MVRTGDALFLAGQRAAHVHVIRRGAVKLVRSDEVGNHRIVRILTEGDIAGLEAFQSDRFEQSAVAANLVASCRVPLGAFRAAINGHPAFRDAVLGNAFRAIRESELWLCEFTGGRYSSRCRVARLLVRLRVGETSLIHRLNLEDMGAILGLAQETVSRVIADLVRRKVLIQVGRGRGNRRFAADLRLLEAIAAGAP
ncbi:MAG: Crp/Fnr family transcriptional regulator [Rhodocyclaceae bacterium]|nr:Crp/Fnr family transcriptional regulator [Rhodocyclaceae bacterium]